MPPSPYEGSWSSRLGRGPVAREAGPTPAERRSHAASVPGTPSSASSGTDGSLAPRRSTSLLVSPLTTPAMNSDSAFVATRKQTLLVGFARSEKTGDLTRQEQLLQHLPEPDKPLQPRRSAPAWPAPSPSGTAGRTARDLLHQTTQDAQLRLAPGDPSQRLPLGGRERVPDEQVAVLEQLTDLPLDPFLAPGGLLCRLELGRPRGHLGASEARSLRSLATAERTALVTSLRTGKVQSGCGTAPKTVAIGSGSNAEPSVVIPWTTKPLASRACWKRRKKASISVWVGSWSRTW